MDMEDDISHDDELAMANGLLDMMTAERDTLKALCVDMLAAMEMADKYVDGEGSRDELDDFNAVLTRARSILK
jgi:hypothetical protein